MSTGTIHDLTLEIEAEQAGQPIRVTDDNIIRPEQDAASHLIVLLIIFELVDNLIPALPFRCLLGIPYLVGGQADVQLNLRSLNLVHPPVHQLIITGGAEGEAPIDLRGNIIDPAALNPGAHICIHVIVG